MARALLGYRPLASHPRDPRAFVFRPSPHRPERGSWAGKIAAHPAHHRFGDRYLPHLQVNVWRVGVKGSGSAYRLAFAPALAVGIALLRPVIAAAVTLGV